MTFKDFDVVELVVDFPEYGVKAGSIGTIVDIYSDGEYEIEITNAEGDTLDCFAVTPEQIRPARKLDVAA